MQAKIDRFRRREVLNDASDYFGFLKQNIVCEISKPIGKKNPVV